MTRKLSKAGLKLAAASAAFAVAALPAGFCDDTENIRLAMNMYSNQRAHQVGDLLTVIITEATSSSKSEALSTAKSATASADAPYFGGAASSSFLSGLSSSIANSQQGLPLSRANSSGSIYTVNGSSTFTGKGSSSSAETLTVTFSARVVDMLENGVMVIRGERKILIKNESVSLVITGLVRTKDIDSKNQVYSYNIADAHIYYENEGEVTRGTKPGYVWRAFQYLNPF